MKDRAGVVGQQGLGPLIGRLGASRPGLGVHLIGHSFGARLVSFALAGLPEGTVGATSPVKSLLLLQGAFSHFAFADALPFDTARGGTLRGMGQRVDGPLLTTHTLLDTAVGRFYPLASVLARQDAARLAGSAPSRWGAFGNDGAQAVDALEVSLGAVGTKYAFAPSVWMNLDANSIIRNGGPPSGAHSDIVHPEIAWAALSASGFFSGLKHPPGQGRTPPCEQQINRTPSSRARTTLQDHSRRFARRAGDPVPWGRASFGDRDPNGRQWRCPDSAMPGGFKVEFLPTGRELAEFLATMFQWPDGEAATDLPTVAQYFAVVGGRVELRAKLKDIFDFQPEPAKIHNYLAEIAAQRPLLIVTTNYDDLMERALATKGCEYDTVVQVTEAVSGDVPDKVLYWKDGESEPIQERSKNLLIDFAQRTVVYKMHGAIDRASIDRAQYVITEDDYISFLSRVKGAIPVVINEEFGKRAFLFLGYGLGDWNFRVVLNRVMKRRDDIQSWAIEPRPKKIEARLWRHRNVEICDELTLDQFVQKMLGLPP